MLLTDVAEVSREVAGTRARLAKIEALSSALRLASPAEAPVVVAWLSGELPQRQIGVGWAALRDAPPPAPEATLSVSEVDASFTRIGSVSGKGSAAARRDLVGSLFGAATAEEQYFLAGLLSGELRQGALDGVMTEAVARASGVPAADVRRAVMLSGSLPATAGAALGGGAAALAEFGLVVGRPVKPMLASSAPSIDAALDKIGSGQEAAVEWKLDGIRVQAHVDSGQVQLFTRTLDDITSRLPEIVSALSALPVRDTVLDGELIALRPDGRPRAFQDTAARAARDIPVSEVPLSAFWFDALRVDGADLLDQPYAERRSALSRVVPSSTLMPQVVTASAEEAASFFSGAVAQGHEGVVVKSLAAPYAAGRRGAGWIKVKPRHVLDLVVLAAEWGHGRRRGWLSNLHLGARDPGNHLPGGPPPVPPTGLADERQEYPPGWVMLGKTFKGLTDSLLEWQTRRFQELEDHRDDWTVYLRPELVVEIAFDGVQRSPRYPGGVALRFARVLRYREDKPASEADTIAAVRALATDPGPDSPRPAS